MGELPACSSESAQCGAGLSAANDPALKEGSGPPESFEVLGGLPQIPQAKLAAKAKVVAEVRAAAGEQKAKPTQMASISQGQSLALSERR